MGHLSGGMSCVKYLMFFFNFLFVICGIILISVGAVVQSRKDLTTFLDSKYVTAPTILIVVGVIIFLLAFLGCCGAVKDNSCMVTTFGILLLIIFVIEVAGAITAYVYKDQFQDFLKQNMNDTIVQGQKDALIVWDEMQTKWDCCGVEGSGDYTKNGKDIPKSCCKPQDVEGDKCKQGSVFQKGCYPKLVEEVKSKIKLVGGVAIGIAVVELLGVAFAFMLSSAIKRGYESA